MNVAWHAQQLVWKHDSDCCFISASLNRSEPNTDSVDLLNGVPVVSNAPRPGVPMRDVLTESPPDNSAIQEGMLATLALCGPLWLSVALCISPVAWFYVSVLADSPVTT